VPLNVASPDSTTCFGSHPLRHGAVPQSFRLQADMGSEIIPINIINYYIQLTIQNVHHYGKVLELADGAGVVARVRFTDLRYRERRVGSILHQFRFDAERVLVGF